MAEADGASSDFLNRRAWHLRWHSRTDSAMLAKQVLGSARDAGARAAALRTLAWQARWCGDFDLAQAHGRAAMRVLRSGENPDVRADVLAILAVADYSRGRPLRARLRVDGALNRLIAPSRPETLIDLLTTRATVQRYRGDVEGCRATMLQALDLAEGAEKARVHHNIARAYDDDVPADAQTGLSHAMLALSDARRYDNRVVLPYVMEMVGTHYRKLGAYGQARRYLTRAVSIGAEDKDARVRCQALHQLALTEDADGDPEQALAIAKQGVELAAGMTYPLWECRFLEHLARLQEDLGDVPAALAAMKRLYRLTFPPDRAPRRRT